jgi:hypothetical protein
MVELEAQLTILGMLYLPVETVWRDREAPPTPEEAVEAVLEQQARV